MQGTVAQAVALVVFGNLAIRGVDIGRFWPDSSVFAYCRSVRFSLIENGQETVLVADPDAWLASLRAGGTAGLYLHHTHQVGDHRSAGFIDGGGRWVIESMGDRGSDYWEAQWLPSQAGAAPSWEVVYCRIATGSPRRGSDEVPLPALIAELVPALDAIKAFADKHDLPQFARVFRSGLSALLDDVKPTGGYQKDIDGPWLPDDARRLMNAAMTAWVFGAMGSWNDLVFNGADAEIYDDLSSRLFDLLTRSLVACANASLTR